MATQNPLDDIGAPIYEGGHLHHSTFDYLKPTEDQKSDMDAMRAASRQYAEAIGVLVPNGPDKTYLLRKVRECAMWANVAITRSANGAPRE